ncbi:hypothetical protein Ancab_023565, partial [Ancistrocladus abbreviatus]
MTLNGADGLWMIVVLFFPSIIRFPSLAAWHGVSVSYFTGISFIFSDRLLPRLHVAQRRSDWFICSPMSMISSLDREGK